MSVARKLDPALVGRVERRLRLAPGAVEVLDFHEAGNRFRASYRRGRETFVMRGLWEVPPELKGKATERPAKKSPRPKTWTPREALHQLRPGVIERIETSYKAEPGAVGRGDLRIRDFRQVRDNVYRVDVYLPATNYTGAWVGLLLDPMLRPETGPRLDGDEFAAVVRVFGMLLKRDREIRAAEGGGNGPA